MREARRKREELAEALLRGTFGPQTPSRLRDFGLSRVIHRASLENEKAGRSRRYLRSPALVRRAVAVSLITVLLLLGGASGAYAASSGALPGSALYGTKIFFERARLFLNPSHVSDARLEMDYCRRRMEELQGLAERADSRGWERWLEEYRRNLTGAESMLDLVSPPESLRLALDLESALREQAERMEEIRSRTAAESLPYLERAYVECREGMARMRRRCGGGEERGNPETCPAPGGDRGSPLPEPGTPSCAGARPRKMGFPWTDTRSSSAMHPLSTP